jgi:hypothetical protein
VVAGLLPLSWRTNMTDEVRAMCERLRKVGVCIHIAAESSAANDVQDCTSKAATLLERLDAAVEKRDLMIATHDAECERLARELAEARGEEKP